MQNGKGSAPRTGADPKKYGDGWERIWEKNKTDAEVLQDALAYWEGYVGEHYDEGCEHYEEQCTCYLDQEEQDALEAFRKFIKRKDR